ncbi:hypothetical protein NEMBOFW57_008489 [Staphylotrichum longicolle]|uniref:Deacetylase sirtuin-type domain-containing protein n=1 Tax=Staphylotrichum longicolle TaxID=669026 RepID=A0AAD4ERI5_9PEZI|nr:hypothetical protein NEMBOFW57_008489 [Staphylotrichum longicolle]
MAPNPEYNSIPAFHAKLARSRRILAVCGAGLSAASGLATFRGAGGLWRNYDATALASIQAWEKDPGLVWMFYAYRRHMALQAKPNKGHYALAALAKRNTDFMCLTQNVDTLQLRLPALPALAPAAITLPPSEPHPLLDPSTPLPPIPPADLPHCPRCATALLRPAVVWFGEPLDAAMLDAVDAWIARDGGVDLVLVVGTSGLVWPAAGFAERARRSAGLGTSVVHVNLDAEDADNVRKLGREDFAFAGDAGEVLAALLEPVIGKWEGEERGFVR